MTDKPLPKCPCCGGKMEFRGPGTGYIVGGCMEDDCGLEVRFFDMRHKHGRIAVFIRDAVEFMRRFNRRPETATAGAEPECWAILPGEAVQVDKACRELHISVAEMCTAVAEARQASAELIRLRGEQAKAKVLAGEMIIDLMSGVDMDVPADRLRLEIYGYRLRQMAGVNE